ncbi:HAD family hydrolase [Chitinivorax sp. B]|uniref:HAD family hydrolase n=1 Tax=Chitinivorax sp. B TaxID=2502235 RepID=UPI0010F5D48E|nr:HAD family hydrolase [Chitinivorax sp. B]
MHQVHAVLFDLDGTLIDTVDDIHAAVNRLLIQFNKPTISLMSCRQFIGHGTVNMLEQLLPDLPADMFDALHQQYLADYECHVAVHSRPFQAVHALLADCQACDLSLAVVTNKQDGMAKKLLAAQLPDIRFDFICGAAAQWPNKPAPDAALYIARQWGIAPAHCLLIGDTVCDIHTARHAGMVAGAALWGYGKADALLATGPDLAFSSPTHLHHHLQRGAFPGLTRHQSLPA